MASHALGTYQAARRAFKPRSTQATLALVAFMAVARHVPTPTDLREKLLDKAATTPAGHKAGFKGEYGWSVGGGIYVRALHGPLPFAVIDSDGQMYALFLSPGDALKYGARLSETTIRPHPVP